MLTATSSRLYFLFISYHHSFLPPPPCISFPSLLSSLSSFFCPKDHLPLHLHPPPGHNPPFSPCLRLPNNPCMQTYTTLQQQTSNEWPPLITGEILTLLLKVFLYTHHWGHLRQNNEENLPHFDRSWILSVQISQNLRTRMSQHCRYRLHRLHSSHQSLPGEGWYDGRAWREYRQIWVIRKGIHEITWLAGLIPRGDYETHCIFCPSPPYLIASLHPTHLESVCIWLQGHCLRYSIKHSKIISKYKCQ